MLVIGQAFSGSTIYTDTYRQLLANECNLPWLSEIRPLRLPDWRFVRRLLYLFHVHKLFL